MAAVDNMNQHTNFHHPFEPYAIQKQFMTALYRCIEDGKIGIFESPTGTGKSLSLICGSLTWLRESKRRQFDGLLKGYESDDEEPQWVVEHAREERRTKALQARHDIERRLTKARERERRLKESGRNGEPAIKRRKIDNQDSSDVHGEEHFTLDDYESDDGTSKGKQQKDVGLSVETQALLKKLGMMSQPEEEALEVEDELKVIYASRTHSQLSQFTTELRRVKFPPSIDPGPHDYADSTIDDKKLSEQLRHLTLGSRKNLCINPNVKKLNSPTAINERCLELQKPSTPADCRCPFLPTKEDQHIVNDFRDTALASICDIEDLASVGKQLSICPYYASRDAMKLSEIITLPYPLLLQKSAREALGLSLTDQVVIIDEAHNLMDAVENIYSATVSFAQLQRGRTQLTMYLQKFRNRLTGKNRVYVTQIVRLLDSLIAYLQRQASDSKVSDHAVRIDDLMTGKGVDQINLFKLTRYLQESKLARKVDGYVVFEEQNRQTPSKKLDEAYIAKPPVRDATIPVLTHVQNFLLTLMNPSAEGRFFYEHTEDRKDAVLRYMLLDPTNHFREIVEEARAVILVGGTMSPMEDYIQHLFSYVDPARIMTLSCGHVIPPSNLVAWPLITSHDGIEFDFTFSRRNSTAMITNAGRVLLALIRNIPDGVVVFFPSYAYLNLCISTWKSANIADSSPTSETLWHLINACKPVFTEAQNHNSPPHSQSTKARNQGSETLLTSYSKAIVSSNDARGALLLSVLNGSLSEGINFSDRLGRAVIVVGMPFPNPHSAEWKAKMEYIAKKMQHAQRDSGTIEAEKAGKAAAQDFYENATMRAVNQAIGRAIRHKDDYAAILLMDRRYGTQRIQEKLPGWIKRSVRKPAAVGDIADGLKTFYAGRR